MAKQSLPNSSRVSKENPTSARKKFVDPGRRSKWKKAENDISKDSWYASLGPSNGEPSDSKHQTGGPLQEAAGETVDGLIASLMEGNKKVGNISSTIESRLQDKLVLLDNPASQASSIERARRLEAASRGQRSAIHMSQREHRVRQTFQLPPELQMYSSYVPLHALWVKYSNALLDRCSNEKARPKIAAADLHGSVMTVVQCKDPVKIGISGITLRETKQAFFFIASDNKIKMVPKAGAVFSLTIRELQVLLNGDGLRDSRAHEFP